MIVKYVKVRSGSGKVVMRSEARTEVMIDQGSSFIDFNCGDEKMWESIMEKVDNISSLSL